MAPIKPLVALLCSAALLMACAPSRAALTCTDYEVTLEPGNQLGGCNSATIAKGAFILTTGTTNASLTNITWTGPQPKVVTAAGVESFTFLGGVDYPYTTSNPGAADCAGTISIKPCTPVCRDLDLTINATSNNAPCTIRIGASLFSETDFIDDGSVGSAARNYTVTATNGRLAWGGQSYPPGTWKIRTQILYPNGNTSVSEPCTVTITDTTEIGPPVAKNTTCFYSNETGTTNYAISLSQFASLPKGNRCARQRLVATTCAPVKRSRICLPQSFGATNAAPTPNNGIDIRRRTSRAKQELTVTLETWDIFGPFGPSADVKIRVYKTKGLVPRDQKDTCIPIFRRY